MKVSLFLLSFCCSAALADGANLMPTQVQKTALTSAEATKLSHIPSDGTVYRYFTVDSTALNSTIVNIVIDSVVYRFVGTPIGSSSWSGSLTIPPSGPPPAQPTICLTTFSRTPRGILGKLQIGARTFDYRNLGTHYLVVEHAYHAITEGPGQ